MRRSYALKWQQYIAFWCYYWNARYYVKVFLITNALLWISWPDVNFMIRKKTNLSSNWIMKTWSNVCKVKTKRHVDIVSTNVNMQITELLEMVKLTLCVKVTMLHCPVCDIIVCVSGWWRAWLWGVSSRCWRGEVSSSRPVQWEGGVG